MIDFIRFAGAAMRAPGALLASALALSPTSLPAQAQPERLSDNDVKALIAQVDASRDTFEDRLDGDFKGSTVQGAHGQTRVARVLQDYQDSVRKLKQGFTAEYAAGPEVATVLKQSNEISAFMLQTPGTMKGRSEWEHLAASLRQLAAAYGTNFPLPDDATARRMNDEEVAATAGLVAAAAERLERDFDKAVGLPAPDREAAKNGAELVRRLAKAVQSRSGDGNPATSEMRELLVQADRLQTHVTAHGFLYPTNWQALHAALAKLTQAFGLTPVP
jgi:hypothetical protein